MTDAIETCSAFLQEPLRWAYCWKVERRFCQCLVLGRKCLEIWAPSEQWPLSSPTLSRKGDLSWDMRVCVCVCAAIGRSTLSLGFSGINGLLAHTYDFRSIVPTANQGQENRYKTKHVRKLSRAHLRTNRAHPVSYVGIQPQCRLMN